MVLGLVLGVCNDLSVLKGLWNIPIPCFQNIGGSFSFGQSPHVLEANTQELWSWHGCWHLIRSFFFFAWSKHPLLIYPFLLRLYLTCLTSVFWLIVQFTPVLALYDPFGVDVPLNFDITHSLTSAFWWWSCLPHSCVHQWHLSVYIACSDLILSSAIDIEYRWTRS